MSDIAGLFDHLIGAAEQRQRHVDAERLGGLEIDDHLDLGEPLHRQIGGLLAFQDAPDVDANQTECLCAAG